MAEARRGLGRGLGALLGESAAAGQKGPAGAEVREIPIAFIRRNPDQPRREFNPADLDELADSIRERGVLQPILVRPLAGTDGEFQIVAGERRWRAAQKAGLHEIPAIVRALDDLLAMEISLIENIQRSDLGVLEEARGYQTMAARFGRSAETIARFVGKSRSHVANTLRLLRLPAGVLEHLEAGRLTAGHARALLDADDAEALADRIVHGGLNVRQAEALGRSSRAGAGAPEPAGRVKDADTQALEHDLSEVLGLKVEVRDRKGAGEVRIAYSNLEQLDEVCRRLTRRA